MSPAALSNAARVHAWTALIVQLNPTIQLDTPRGKAREFFLIDYSEDQEDKENQSFSEATPSGTLEIFVTNPNVVGTFEPGGYYYLDLIPCS